MMPYPIQVGRYVAVLRLLVILLLASVLFSQTALAITPKRQYLAAEKAYTALKKRPQQQKYRDKWMACIEKFQRVYQLDPSGPWAAAGLYKTGLLYLELHKHSRLEEDRQLAIDTFRQVIHEFPQSQYMPKSRNQLTRLGQKIPAPRNAVAAAQLKKGHAAYKRLLASTRKQKYRDQWEACIQHFENAYQTDSKGPVAAEALYMIGSLYKGLAAKSRRNEDDASAVDYFQRVQREFPESPFARKAESESPAKDRRPTPKQDTPPHEDPLAGLIKESENETAVKPISQQTTEDGLVTISGLRFWSNPSYTRIVIDADQETSFSHRLLNKDPSLKKPQRLYIDMRKSRLGNHIQGIIPINDELLIDARAGQYSSETVRIVVDIKSFKTYKIFSLKNPFRVVLDVWGEADAQTATVGPMGPSTGKLSPGAIARQLALGVSRIVIDPGHGGKDYGAPGYLKGVHEKNIVLQIAKRLARKVESELKCDAILTRTTDRYLTLEERTAIANTQNADLFVSIHTNAVRNARAYGIETFFLNLATDDDAILVAARENATSTKNISDLESILNDLMQNAKINESSRLAAMVQTETCHHLKKKYSYIHSKGVKKAPFYVLLGAQMPAILVETAFISHPRECKRLTTPKYQEALCDGIIRGIRKYIKETSPTAFFHPPADGDNKG
jgi:N-acetylmuramoyl-L-alanine amidase